MKKLFTIFLIALAGGFIFLAVLEDYKEKQYKKNRELREKQMKANMRKVMKFVNS